MSSVATANRLRDGVAVYFTGTSWSESFLDGEVADDKAAAQDLLERAQRDEVSNLIVAAYLIKVEESDGERRPVDKKERVRLVGPSVRPDLQRTPTA
ncbi:MAG: DUF2849 domain-containing protein [Myxococcota bacterium]